MSERALTLARDFMAARLEADGWFVDISVLTERKADIVAAIERSIGPMKAKGGKSGTCVVVMSPVATDEYPDTLDTSLNGTYSFRVLENPLINYSGVGTGKEALSTAKRIVMLFKNWSCGGLCGNMVALKPSIVPVADPVAPVAYEVRFTAFDNSPASQVKVGPVHITPSYVAAPQTVTITCPTAGASIYFTTDGSYPSPQNPNATLYTAPFPVSNPTTVYAGAFLTGNLASNVSHAVLS